MVGSAITLTNEACGHLNVIAPLEQTQRVQRWKGILAGPLGIAVVFSTPFFFFVLGSVIGGVDPFDLLKRRITLTLTPSSIFILCTSVAFAILGAGGILYKTTHEKQRIAVRKGEIYEIAPGKLSDIKSFRRAELRWKGGEGHVGEIRSRTDAIVDISSLDEKGNGRVAIYENQPEFLRGTISSHGMVNGQAIAGALPYALTAMVCNALRFCFLPFYRVSQVVKQKITPPLEKDRVTLGQIPKEMALSLWRILIAIPYALAYMTAIFYSFGNPIGGRILVSKVEAAWNYNEQEEAIIPAHRGFSPCGGGYLGADREIMKGATMTPCRAPIGYARFEEGRAVEVEKWSFKGRGLSPCSMAIEIGNNEWEFGQEKITIHEDGSQFAIFDPKKVFSRVPSKVEVV